MREGYRSGLEGKVAKQIKARTGRSADYESHVIRYDQPLTHKRYTPDFVLPNGIIIETKGRFVTKDRQKHVFIKQQHPLLDIRFVFDNPRARISKSSKTTYAMWCKRYGFQFAKGLIPEEWFDEPRDQASIVAIAAFVKEKK
jgi:hypothetical protein